MNIQTSLHIDQITKDKDKSELELVFNILFVEQASSKTIQYNITTLIFLNFELKVINHLQTCVP